MLLFESFWAQMFAKLLRGNARLAWLMRKAQLSSQLSFNLRGEHLKDSLLLLPLYSHRTIADSCARN